MHRYNLGMPKSGLPVRRMLALILAMPLRRMAQGETTSAIVGSVTDPTGAAIPGATVTVTNVENGLKRSVKTDDAGRFSFPQLKPGTYSVKAEADRFEAAAEQLRVRRSGAEANGRFQAQHRIRQPKHRGAGASAADQPGESQYLDHADRPSASKTFRIRAAT